MKHVFGTIATSACLLAAPAAQAALITSSLGNTASGFLDGDIPSLFAISPVQSGQAAPFDAALGNEAGLAGSNAAGSWTHTFGAISDPIVSASLEIGLIDHDSQASGDQVALFSVDGVALTTEMNLLLEGHGGATAEFNTYTIDLTALAASFADGSADITLNLQGPGLTPCLFGCTTPVVETTFNAAYYIFATLTIQTRDTPPPPNGVPEPTSLALLGLGMGALAWRRKHRTA
ncbi:PEP-CTERM sorting domain-containing protein [Nitrogeniibacter aestuarii]|uniref:PEP-CTERM sorting domain-containing protein n=1 Tax=Nitrogeniibacter aestuarii TaxID=2815343 RepID=UPI001E3CC426|nr:PEP-CTERM sorting domain-containing protein [Nitrogeniibacter aestuarii]